jgi:uncharacterized protein YaaQ
MKMMMAIVQAEDVSRITKALVEAGHRVTQISTTGGWLRRDNATLLMGVEDERMNDALNVFRSMGEHREADARAPVEGPGDPKSQKSKIVIGSATIFVLNVDQFERY